MGILKKQQNPFWSFRRATGAVHDIGLSVIARPAPRTQRPLAGILNPYPYGCSVLCNHPRDPELRDVVWKPRMLVNDQSCADHFENSRPIMTRGRRHRSGSSSCAEGPFVYNWNNQKLANMGEQAERARSPTESRHMAVKRCAKSAGPSAAERRSSRGHSSLVLDLRPWKSFDNVSSIADGQHDGMDNMERFELTSPRTREEKPARPTRPIRRPDTVPSKSYKEQNKKTLKRSKSKVGQHAILAPENNVYTDYETENDHQSDSSPVVHDKEFGENFSQMNPEDETLFRSMNSVANGELLAGSSAPDGQQPGEEMVDLTSALEELEENVKNMLVQHDKNDRNPDLEGETTEITAPQSSSADDMIWLAFPRAGNTFGARFELPIDLRKLKTMTPLEYLSNHVVATRCRQRLNEVVFTRHSSGSSSPKPGIPSQKLFSALTEILGFRLDRPAEEKLSGLVDFTGVEELTRAQFDGVGALAERIGRQGISQRDDLEISDFNLLQHKMSYLEMSPQLRQLFNFICKEEMLQ